MAQRSWVRGLGVPRHATTGALVALVWVIAGATGVGCASGGGNDGGVRPETSTTDTPRDGAATDVPTDSPPGDAPRDVPPLVDGGSGCGTGPVCTGLTHCVGGTCVDYPPCRGDSTCPDPGDVCLSRRCIPGTDDPDRDGSPASEDCDETDPTRNPRLPEICNTRDDNCNGAPDEGDPAQVCANDGTPGLCMGGVCSCPAGSFDLDPDVLGCECAAAPAVTDGVACTSAIDLGNFPDTGATMNVSGNALPNGREVWYSFNAVDSPDSTCDNFHVRVQLTANPGSAYEMLVFRGNCDTAECGGAAMSDFSWATDIAPTEIPGTGECPCSPQDDRALEAGHVGAPGLNFCSDNSGRFNVRVRRVAGVADACDAFTLEITNGVYDS